MENFVIFGDSPFAERMFSYIKIEGIAKVKAFTQEKNYIHREYIDGIKVIPFDELEPSEDFSVCFIRNRIFKDEYTSRKYL